jgi:hypothetical protein
MQTLRGFFRSPLARPSELEYHLLLSRDLKLLEEQDYERLSGQEVRSKTNAVISHESTES